jgi:hypothetical protein
MAHKKLASTQKSATLQYIYRQAMANTRQQNLMRLLPSFNLAGELRAPTSPELPLLRRGG